MEKAPEIQIELNSFIQISWTFYYNNWKSGPTTGWNGLPKFFL